MKKAIGSDSIWLLVIILIGSILRFWNFPNMPFMHDELSALSRLEFDNFTDLILHGVMLGDTHPAGIQTFLYYWTSLFGTSEMVVKLPFIVAGVLSIWISYKVGKLWFDGITGLLTATMIASTQFFVMYSQIARPYVSGLLLTLIMVYYWSLYFFKKRKTLYLCLFVLFAAMSSYNHHFSLLFAAIIGFSGIFMLKDRKDTVVYILAGISIFILYLPHLNIFISQLSQGGIGGEGGWLAKPKSTFFFEFADYLLQFSMWGWLTLVGIILFIIIGGTMVRYDKGMSKRLLLLSWFFLPILIGYGYSVLRNPVIQYSMLIFSTPYIYIFIFSFHKRLGSVSKSIVISLLLVINLYGLIHERSHYNVFYHQPYEELFKTALVDNANNNVTIIDDCIPYYHDYYFDKFQSRTNYYTKRGTKNSISGFAEVIESIESDVVVTHSLTGQELQIVQSSYPYITGRRDGFTHEIYTFSKIRSEVDSLIKKDQIAATNFLIDIGGWKDVSKYVVFDSLENNYYCGLDGITWGPSISFNLMEYVPDGNGIIDIEMKAKITDTISKGLLVSSVIENGESIYWNATNIQDYKPDSGDWAMLYLSVDIQNTLRSRSNMKGLTLKVNVWNPTKANLMVDEIKIYLRNGNPLRYSLYRKINSR